MIRPDEAGLAAYSDVRDERKYGRLLLARTFQATVAAADLTGTPYVVQVDRGEVDPTTGQSHVDPHWYACTLPGYQPQVGDRVQLMWVDDDHAVVVAVLEAAGMARGVIASPQRLDDQQPTQGTSIRIPAVGNLPQSFTSLRCRWKVRTTSGNVADELRMQFNGDTGNHYDYEYLPAMGTGVPSATIQNNLAYLLAGTVPGGAVSGDSWASGWFEMEMILDVVARKAYTAMQHRWDTAFGLMLVAGAWQTFSAQLQYITLFLSAGSFASSGCRIVTDVIP